MTDEEIIHQYDHLIGKNFGGMVFAEGYEALGGNRFRFIKDGTPPTGYDDMDNQVILSEGQMRVLVAQTFGEQVQSRIENAIDVTDEEPERTIISVDACMPILDAIRRIVREELENFFKDKQAAPETNIVPAKNSRENPSSQELTIPMGKYIIGEDIPAGRYTIISVKPVIVKLGREMKDGAVSSLYFTEFIEQGQSANTTFIDGTFLEVLHASVKVKPFVSVF